MSSLTGAPDRLHYPAASKTTPVLGLETTNALTAGDGGSAAHQLTTGFSVLIL